MHRKMTDGEFNSICLRKKLYIALYTKILFVQNETNARVWSADTTYDHFRIFAVQIVTWKEGFRK